jgi:hypothetical protein
MWMTSEAALRCRRLGRDVWRSRTRWTTVALLAVVLAVGDLTAAGSVAADGHEPEGASTYNTSDGEVQFDIRLPDRADHYPGDHPVYAEQDGYNASITYFARVERPMREQGAGDGLYLDYLGLDTTGFVDYSECSTARNTAEFGIDRKSDNSGFQSDESLLEHRRETNLERDGLEVVFFDWDDLSGDPPYLGPSDTVVARQGKGSRDGPCLKMAEEPGWYRVQAYASGTVATECGDRPRDDSRESAECESDDGSSSG